MGKLVEEIFSHEDKDKDGYISHEEFWSQRTKICCLRCRQKTTASNFIITYYKIVIIILSTISYIHLSKDGAVNSESSKSLLLLPFSPYERKKPFLQKKKNLPPKKKNNERQS